MCMTDCTMIHIYKSTTAAPDSVMSRIFTLTSMPSSLKTLTMTFEIESKFSVARARMVGPAPDRHMPRRPGCVFGVTDARMRGRPGMSSLRYG